MTTTLDERLTEAATGTLELFGVYLGTRLGLYGELSRRGRLTAPGLADAAGIHPRYAREWLEQQAVAGLLAVDDVTRPAGERRYRPPAAHEVVDAYRRGTGVPYTRYGTTFRRGQSRGESQPSSSMKSRDVVGCENIGKS